MEHSLSYENKTARTVNKHMQTPYRKIHRVNHIGREDACHEKKGKKKIKRA